MFTATEIAFDCACDKPKLDTMRSMSTGDRNSSLEESQSNKQRQGNSRENNYKRKHYTVSAECEQGSSAVGTSESHHRPRANMVEN